MNLSIEHWSGYFQLTLLFQLHLILGFFLLGAKWGKQVAPSKRSSATDMMQVLNESFAKQNWEATEK